MAYGSYNKETKSSLFSFLILTTLPQIDTLFVSERCTTLRSKWYICRTFGGISKLDSRSATSSEPWPAKREAIPDGHRAGRHAADTEADAEELENDDGPPDGQRDVETVEENTKETTGAMGIDPL